MSESPSDPSRPEATSVHSSPAILSRRNMLLGAGALAGLYVVDRTNVAVEAEKAINPFDSESKMLEPEKYEVTITWLPDTVKRWHGPLVTAARKYRMDPNYTAILMTMESGGWAAAKSPVGAQGLMQLMPETEKDIYDMWLLNRPNKYDIMKPETNIEFGTAYVAHLRDWLSGQDYDTSLYTPYELIAAGYNGGPGAAADFFSGKGVKSDETLVYSRDALNMWRERAQPKGLTYDRWLERGGQELITKAEAAR